MTKAVEDFEAFTTLGIPAIKVYEAVMNHGYILYKQFTY